MGVEDKTRVRPRQGERAMGALLNRGTTASGQEKAAKMSAAYARARAKNLQAIGGCSKKCRADVWHCFSTLLRLSYHHYPWNQRLYAAFNEISSLLVWHISTVCG